MLINDVSINQAIINILDLENGKVILNDFKLALDVKNYEYISKIINKVIKDKNFRRYIFKNECNLVKEMTLKFFKKGISFNELAKNVTEYLFDIMSCYNTDSCDLATIEINTEIGQAIAFIKIDYVEEISHIIKNKDDKTAISLDTNNSLSKNKTKCAAILVNQNDNVDLMVLDNQQIKVESEDDKINFFTRDFLESELIKSSQEHTENFMNCYETFIRKFVENPATAYKLRNFITEYLINKKEVDIYLLSNDLPCGDDIKQSFIVFMIGKNPEKFDIFKDSLKVKEKVKLNIEGDIKVSLDRSVYNRNEAFEVVKNNNGTINIVLKNISWYTEN